MVQECKSLESKPFANSIAFLLFRLKLSYFFSFGDLGNITNYVEGDTDTGHTSLIQF